MFKTKTYEVTENWLDRVEVRTFGYNRKYLTKALLYNKVYDILEEHRYKEFNFELKLTYDKLILLVKVTKSAIEVYHDKKLIYEQTFLAPRGFDETADWLAWRMVDDR